MKIHDRHQFHGAALIQIAEHPAFTAINAFTYGREKSTNAYTVNDNIGVYLKYGTAPHGSYGEYKFTFAREHLDELAALKAKQERTHVALICWEDREVCCLKYSQLRTLIEGRRDLHGADEDAYTIYVQAPKRSNFRAYVSPPGVRKRKLGETLIARSAFPSCIFPAKP